MTPTELLERIALGESQTLEFKTSFDKASIESLVAFANAGSLMQAQSAA